MKFSSGEFDNPNFTEDEKIKIQLVASLVLEAFDGGDWPLAKRNWEDADLEIEERAACWQYFNSRQRAYLKGEDRKYLEGQ